MSNEPNVKKVSKTVQVTLELDAAVMKRFSHEEDSGYGVAYVRALEEATRGVMLTGDDYRIIAEKADENMKRRMEKRDGKGSKGGK